MHMKPQMNNQNGYLFIYTWYKIKQILPTIAKPITNTKAYQARQYIELEL